MEIKSSRGRPCHMLCALLQNTTHVGPLSQEARRIDDYQTACCSMPLPLSPDHVLTLRERLLIDAEVQLNA